MIGKVYGSSVSLESSDPTAAAETSAAQSARSPLWARLLLVCGAVLLVLSGGTLLAGTVLLHRYTGSIEQTSLLGAGGVQDGKKATLNGPINVLLMGIDTRGDPSQPIRADSIIILHITASHDRAYIVSVPRDSDVAIPPFPKTGYKGGRGKINAAYAFGSNGSGGRAGGFELLALTIKNLTGITFNAGAIVDFDGFKAIVDALGGVNMCVDEKVISIHVGFDATGKQRVPYKGQPPHLRAVPGVRPAVYQRGCQHLNSWQALDYVRQRDLLEKGDGDYGRQRHQQQFLKAIAKGATSSGVITNPARLDSVLRAAGKALTVDTGGVPVTDWLLTISGIGGDNITMVKTNAGKYQSFKVDGESRERLTPESLQLFDAVRNDTVDTFVAAHTDWVSGDS